MVSRLEKSICLRLRGISFGWGFQVKKQNPATSGSLFTCSRYDKFSTVSLPLHSFAPSAPLFRFYFNLSNQLYSGHLNIKNVRYHPEFDYVWSKILLFIICCGIFLLSYFIIFYLLFNKFIQFFLLFIHYL